MYLKAGPKALTEKSKDQLYEYEYLAILLHRMLFFCVTLEAW